MTGINPQMLKKGYTYILSNLVGIEPLVSFRILFSILMLISVIRFYANGWIEQLYLNPVFHFKYFGFHWVPAPTEEGIYAVFISMILACIGIGLGLFYRICTLLFFILFTYTELIDASNYLNHYYFISLISFCLIFLPANKYFAIDNLLFKNKQKYIHAWQINIIKFQVGVLYVYAGIAKLNSSWIFEALPLKIWLPANMHLPVIGELMTYSSTAYLFSWTGIIFDLSIFFFLIYKRTRIFAYLAVVIFHLLTFWLFPIGMFPFVMIFSNLIFFSTRSHARIYERIMGRNQEVQPTLQRKIKLRTNLLILSYVILQLTFPFRYLLYPENLFWTEQGYRFSWRVMLMEKAGHASFTVQDSSGKLEIVDNKEFLTPFQEKMMSTQADFIVQYARMLSNAYTKKGFDKPEVYADVFVSLNGDGSKRFIDNTIDLSKERDTFASKKFIINYP